MKNQFGRSMVEMLGVLGVIGLLSIAGVEGYQYAVLRHRSNVVLKMAHQIAADIVNLPRMYQQTIDGYGLRFTDRAGMTLPFAEGNMTATKIDDTLFRVNTPPLSEEQCQAVLKYAENYPLILERTFALNEDGNLDNCAGGTGLLYFSVDANYADLGIPVNPDAGDDDDDNNDNSGGAPGDGTGTGGGTGTGSGTGTGDGIGGGTVACEPACSDGYGACECKEEGYISDGMGNCCDPETGEGCKCTETYLRNRAQYSVAKGEVSEDELINGMWGCVGAFFVSSDLYKVDENCEVYVAQYMDDTCPNQEFIKVCDTWCAYPYLREREFEYCPCGENQVWNSEQFACLCDAGKGYVWNDDKTECVQCSYPECFDENEEGCRSISEYEKNEDGYCVLCREDKPVSDGNNGCTTCANKYGTEKPYWDGDSCEECPFANQIWDVDNSVCVCADGYGLSGTSCLKCTEYEYKNEDGYCVPCGEDKPVFYGDNGCINGDNCCITCASASERISGFGNRPYWDGDSCEPCPAETPAWDGYTCQPCPDETPAWDGDSCEPCPAEKPIWSGQPQSGCVSCDDTRACQECIAGATDPAGCPCVYPDLDNPGICMDCHTYCYNSGYEVAVFVFDEYGTCSCHNCPMGSVFNSGRCIADPSACPEEYYWNSKVGCCWDRDMDDCMVGSCPGSTYWNGHCCWDPDMEWCEY